LLRSAHARSTLERIRFWAFALGCVSLFWQWDLAAADVLFGAGVVLSFAVWALGAPGFDLDWPQPLLLLALLITALVTTIENGQTRFFEITVYLAVVALALAAALRHDPRRLRTIEAAMVLAGIITAVTVGLGAAASHVNAPFLRVFAYDYLRGEGLFKDPNVAGAFVACTYPLAAARSLRHRRGRLLWLGLATVVFSAGVVFSYSRWALLVLALGVVGTMVVLAFARDWKPLGALGVMCVVAGIVGHQTLPSYRYQPVQSYDETGRLNAWILSLELLLERPLGIGAGAFEGIAVERSGQLAGNDTGGPPGAAAAASEPPPSPGTAATSRNMVSNGAFDGTTGWRLPAFAATIADPTSPTGHALRKITTDLYQDPGISIPIEPGQVYSFGAEVKSDGTPALLIIHWRDANDLTISQANTDPVISATWTETEISDQRAPSDARAVVVLLSNLEPGTQYFTALRVVAGPTVPAWADDLQHIERTDQNTQTAAGLSDPARCHSTASCSTHNTFLRVLVETGVPGFLTMCAYWLTLGWSLLKMGRRGYPWSLAFVLVLVAGLTIDTLHWRQLWIYLAVAAAMFVRAPSFEEARVKRPLAAEASFAK
jgi:O-antigen ligase